MGMSEMRSLLQDPHAPSPAQAAAMGSRNALSPMRARPRMHNSLGHAQVRTHRSRGPLDIPFFIVQPLEWTSVQY